MQIIKTQKVAQHNKKLEAAIHQRGQSMVEYLIIVALVGVSSMVVMRSVGQNVKVQFAKVVKALGGQVEGSPRADAVTKAMYQRSDLRNFMNGTTGKKTSDDSESSSDGSDESSNSDKL